MKLAITAITILGLCAAAGAADFTIDAYANSSTGGTGVSTINLTAGEQFFVTVDPSSLWSAGDLPRWSNADGLTHDLFATGTDASGQVAGTLIGQDFGLWSEGNLSAPFGTLVGQIGNGDYFVLGTNYSGIAGATGTLNMYYWDENFSDNSGSIVANAVPEPAPFAMVGLGMLGLLIKRRRK